MGRILPNCRRAIQVVRRAQRSLERFRGRIVSPRIEPAVRYISEPLEPRVLLSTVTWVGAAGGGDGSSWSDANNWERDVGGSPVMQAPQAGDDVVIPDVTGTSSVLFNSSASSVMLNSLVSAEAFQISGNTLTLDGAGSFEFNAGLTISGGALTANSDVTADALTMSGGTLAGDGEIEVTSTLSWSGGTMGGDGTTRFSGGSGSISGLSLFLGRRFDNAGHITFSVTELSFNVSGTTSGVINNESGATFDVTGEGAFRSDDAAGTYAFNNFGEFIRSGVGTTTKFNSTGAGSVPFNNQADGMGIDKVHVQSGTLELLGGGCTAAAYSRLTLMRRCRSPAVRTCSRIPHP